MSNFCEKDSLISYASMDIDFGNSGGICYFKDITILFSGIEGKAGLDRGDKSLIEKVFKKNGCYITPTEESFGDLQKGWATHRHCPSPDVAYITNTFKTLLNGMSYDAQTPKTTIYKNDKVQRYLTKIETMEI